MVQIRQQVRLLISFRCLIARRALFFTFTGYFFHGLVIDRITAGIFENIYRNDVKTMNECLALIQRKGVKGMVVDSII